MAVAAMGWATLAEAVSYFANERFDTTHWDAIATDDLKNKVLNMAYNRILYHPDLSGIPEAGSETTVQAIILIKAQCEMAYYLALHLADEDRRKGLQAQAVIEAGIVKEKYWTEMLDNLPVPPFILILLDGFKIAGFFAVGLERDEDKKIGEGEGE